MIISEEARKLHEESIVVDLHIDPILQHFLFGYDLREEHHASWKPRKRRLLFHLISLYAKLRNLHQPFFNHIDIPRMVRGGYTFGAFGVHYWPCQSETGWKMIQKQIAYLHQITTEDDRLILANNPEDIRRAFQQKKIAAFIGVEGTHCLGQDGKQTMIMRLNRMEELYKKHGVCYLTLTHFS
ncbi:MAG: membrane dipeptidase, partial [bacterium]